MILFKVFAYDVFRCEPTDFYIEAYTEIEAIEKINNRSDALAKIRVYKIGEKLHRSDLIIKGE